jgi:hypothetical protein
MIAKDIYTKEAISYHFIESETNKEYRTLKEDIAASGFTIKAVIIDGRRGLFRMFEPFPIQMCHFHQKAIITRYLTRNPKTKPAQELKRIVSHLSSISECRFTLLLSSWHKRHHEFLGEKTHDQERKHWHYTHRRLRSAYRSLKNHLPYLFTYQKYPQLHIQNTTNSLDGGVFSPMKMLLKIHRGMSIEMKKKLIVDYLENGVK